MSFVYSLSYELLRFVVVVWLTTLLIFTIIFYSPGGRERIEPVFLGKSSTFTTEIKYGYWQVYSAWSLRILHADMGFDNYHDDVLSRLKTAIPRSIGIIGFAVFFSLIWSSFVIIFDNIKINLVFGRITMIFLFAIFSLPAYVIGRYIGFSSLLFTNSEIMYWYIIALAGLLLSLFDGYYNEVTQATKSQIGSIRTEAYYLMLIVKGAKTWRHIRNAVFIYISHLMFMRIAVLIGGSVILEYVFNIRGLGDLLIQSARTRDSNLLLGIALTMGLIVALMQFSHRIMSMVLDPRLRNVGKI